MENTGSLNFEGQSFAYSEGDYKDTWLRARELLEVIGPIPVTFTTPIRSLIHDHKNGKDLSPASHFTVCRLLRTPTLKAMFYYISLSYFNEKLTNSAYLSSSDLVRLYKPRDTAAIIAVMYLSRRLKRVLELRKKDCTSVMDDIIIGTELGGFVGQTIPALGMLKGLFAGSFRELGFLVLEASDAKLFSDYREYLALSNSHHDLEYEYDKWGCTHLDISANAIQQMGFGVSEAYSIISGLGDTPPDSPQQGKEAFEYALANEWVVALRTSKSEPSGVHSGNYYPKEKEKHKLLYASSKLIDEGSRYKWLHKSKDDISPRETPQLFQEYLNELENPTDIKDFYQENLPKEVLDSMSEEELSQLADSPKEI